MSSELELKLEQVKPGIDNATTKTSNNPDFSEAFNLSTNESTAPDKEQGIKTFNDLLHKCRRRCKSAEIRRDRGLNHHSPLAGSRWLPDPAL
jgi:hypothetical protein